MKISFFIFLFGFIIANSIFSDVASSKRNSGDCAKLNMKNGYQGEYNWCPDRTGKIPPKPAPKKKK